MKRLVLVALMVLIAGCGGGGNSGGSTASAQKASIADGAWTSTGNSTPGVTVPSIGVYADSLGIYNSVNLLNGNIDTSGYFAIGTFGTGSMTTYTSDGAFTVSGNSLTYTLTSQSTSTGIIGQSVSSMASNPIHTLTINKTNTVTISVSANSMIWKDANGNIVATFTR